MVYVQNYNGQPLMPTNRHGRVKHLLRDGKAKVVKRCPFTIRLTHETTEYKQPLTLGIDTGSGSLGVAVSNEKNDIIYTSEVQLRNNITKKMNERASYRRTRRGRKTRYRKPRWLNRKNSIKNGRFSPTMVSKIQSHVKEIEYVKSILPITTMVFETSQFDMHLMKNPKLGNPKVKHWGYQKGANYGFENTKARVLNRDNYTCQYCKGKKKCDRLEVHHIVFRSNGGSDEEDNLITLCSSCHKKLHNGKIKLKLEGKKIGTLKYATQMNSIRKQLLLKYPEAIETFGYITKENRLLIDVEKQHYYDACVIATQGNPFTIKTRLYRKKSIPKGDFKQSKGRHSEQKLTTCKINGFRKYDKVKYFGKTYFIKARMATGYSVLMNIEGKKVDFSKMPKGLKTPKLSNCYRLTARTSILIDDLKL